jgi:membrane-associated phospholipid phosphatase
MADMQHDRTGELVRPRMSWVAIAAAVLLLGLAGLTLVVRTTPLPLDSAALSWALDHRVTWATTIAVAVTTTGSGLPAYAFAALSGAIACPRRLWIGVAIAELALLVGQGIRLLLVTWRQRPRPPAHLWATSANGPSFPSGHTTTSALVAALLCTAVARRFRGRTRVTLQLICLAWGVAVGLTRVYLAVHWVTDVLGGWLLAGGLSVLTLAVVLALPAERWRMTGPRVPERP